MNASLTELIASLLLLVANAVSPSVSGQADTVVNAVARDAAHQFEPGQSPDKHVEARKVRVMGHTPYYDFGRRQSRAKD